MSVADIIHSYIIMDTKKMLLSSFAMMPSEALREVGGGGGTSFQERTVTSSPGSRCLRHNSVPAGRHEAVRPEPGAEGQEDSGPQGLHNRP
ncbi:hypothetical protein [Thermogymnomonas acidicola]|uniref:hypothetical protein n=1 Tax=Thermogymnomonas acidicola TaxID=399579 RepID=UPI0013969655|nr:hypothetical protein [Thermogymnomonas acidicola]